MLTLISVQIENDPHSCGIRIKSSLKTDTIENISSVVISRKEATKATWRDIYTIEVTKLGNLAFELLDISTKSGTEYIYNIDVYGKNSQLPIEFEQFDSIKCKFDSLYVGDTNKGYFAATNFKTETKRNTQVEYVTTLSGKYPHRISNSDTDYTTGTSTGLFLKLSEDKKRLEPDYDHSYSDEVLNFLCDGKNKIIKTHDGQIWYVSIDGSPNKVYSDYIGMNAIQFSWTEIGSVPTYGMVRMAGG